MEDIETRLNQIETCIKLGQFSLARKHFSRINLSTIPRPLCLKASNLARRCDELSKSLKILGPIVRDKYNAIQKASENEIADYAYSLCQMGLSLEAEKLLAPLREQNNSSSLFFSALLSFTQWDYESARSYLESFVLCEDVEEYKRMVGRSNLVSTYIYLEEWDLAQKSLKVVSDFANAQNLKLLKNLCSEQEAEIYVLTGDTEMALAQLTTAKERSRDSGARINHWLEKWTRVLQAKRLMNREGEEQLKNFIKVAEAEGDWETCRDIDFHLATLFEDETRFNKLYFGTPYEHYRKRLATKMNFHLSKTYTHILGRGRKGNYQIDLKSFSVTDSGRSIDVGLTKIEWKLIQMLCSDFYKPLKLGELFGKLFEDEYFDPFHSSNRIHQIISRLNRRFSMSELSMRVIGTGFGYRLESERELHIIVPSKKTINIDPKLVQLKSSIQSTKLFKASEVQGLLDLSARSTNRWLKEKVDQNEIEKVGAGKKTLYKINSKIKIAS